MASRELYWESDWLHERDGVKLKKSVSMASMP
jgi:hypothetical protein